MNPKAAIRQKIARLRAGGAPRVLDLFAGCGGLSLGFQAAGCRIEAAIEFDPDAARTHGLNFHRGDPRHCKPRDITATKPYALTSELDLGHPGLAFDIIVGGPPCQAFARVGRSKLREVADHPEAFRHDQRARLYIEYLDYVEACSPLAVLMENVPDMLNHGGHNIAEEVCEVLESRGYVCGYTLLNAAMYGVPQMRERMFLIAYRKEIAARVEFPAPTHWIDLPPGYEGSRAVALKLLNRGSESTSSRYCAPPESHQSLTPAITAEQAIGDLPPIDARRLLSSGQLKRGARRFDKPVLYVEPSELHPYAALMRTWSGFAGSDTLNDHVIRYLPRDYALFARLEPGDQYPEAYARAESMFEELLAKLRLVGSAPRRGTREWENLRASIVPPYDPGKFPNKWRKMEHDKPARTLMAHLGKDSYSHIHYDSAQARTISVREAARLQSFPDGFVFSGTMNPAFRQIGNAVPPLLAKAIAVVMLDQMRAGIATEPLELFAGAA
jgi:DNA (cytosine-5)-methyltransferase 1